MGCSWWETQSDVEKGRRRLPTESDPDRVVAGATGRSEQRILRQLAEGPQVKIVYAFRCSPLVSEAGAHFFQMRVRIYHLPTYTLLRALIKDLLVGNLELAACGKSRNL